MHQTLTVGAACGKIYLMWDLVKRGSVLWLSQNSFNMNKCFIFNSMKKLPKGENRTKMFLICTL